MDQIFSLDVNVFGAGKKWQTIKSKLEQSSISAN